MQKAKIVDNEWDYKFEIGDIVTIASESENRYLVYKEGLKGHDGNLEDPPSICKNGECWYVYKQEIEIIEDEINIGDIVKIRENLELKELYENDWYEFARDITKSMVEYPKQYVVKRVWKQIGNVFYAVVESEGSILHLPFDILEKLYDKEDVDLMDSYLYGVKQFDDFRMIKIEKQPKIETNYKFKIEFSVEQEQGDIPHNEHIILNADKTFEEIIKNHLKNNIKGEVK